MDGEKMGKRIVVVDDDSMNLRMAEFILQKDGYEVCKLESGAACLDYLEKDIPDMILLDVQMPIMDGFATLEAIRAKEENANIPIAFLTASADENTVEKAKMLGVENCVKKPFLPQDLLECVKKNL